MIVLIPPITNLIIYQFPLTYETTGKFHQDIDRLTNLVVPDLRFCGFKAYIAPGVKRHIIEKNAQVNA